MSMQLLYQNRKTGLAHDITSLVTSAKWSTKRAGSPASLDLTLLDDGEVKIDHGGIVAMKDGSNGLFYGYVFKYTQDDEGKTQVTAYDQIRYLKNKSTYVFKGKRADQILSQIAADFQLKLGSLPNTVYVIPSMIEDSKPLLDIILKALDLTLINKKEMFYLWDDYGKLVISNVRSNHLDLIIGENSLATGYSYQSDIDSNSANKIKLVQDNKETGKRDVFIVQDSNSMRQWGILQHYNKVDEQLNKAQIEAQADNLLALKNRPTLLLDIDAMANLTVRAGRAVFVKLANLGLSGWYIVDECNHDLLKETMSLKLVVM